MQKLLSNKWGKLLLVAAYSLLFMILAIAITKGAIKEPMRDGSAVGALFVYISLPALYFVTVVLNYLRFVLTKFVRYIIFVATMIFFVVGIIFIFGGCLTDGHVVNDPIGHAYIYGMSAGSIVTWTLLFFDFRKMGYNPQNAEKRTWLSNLITWGIYYTAPFVLTGFLFMILHGIKSGFLVVALLIVFLVLTAGSVYKSIRDYGSPLGSSKEWDEWRKKHPIKTSGSSSSSYSSGSSSSSSSSSSSGGQRRVISGDIYHKIIGMYNSWVEITGAGVYEQAPNTFQIELTLRDTYNGNDKGPDWGHTIEHLARELVDQVGDIVSNMGASCTISVRFE